jgi:tryptophan 2,3-dioxygenase
MPLTYSSYLKVEDLLSLQHPRSEPPAHDELLFIVIHQTYELWFKALLHEIDHLAGRLRGDDSDGARATLRRCVRIARLAAAQWDVLETMTPAGFYAFRDRLGSASGFQSVQFREIEAALGAKRSDVLSSFEVGSVERARLERRLAEPCLWDAFLRYLSRRGKPVPPRDLDRDVAAPVAPSVGLQEVLAQVYRDDPTATDICERLLDLDELLQEWRYRHVKLVERILGNRPGTGGSVGVAYLRSTLFRPFFPDLWQLRSALGAP